MQKNTIIIGCGYIGKKVAKILNQQHRSVIAVVKSEVSKQQLSQMGFLAFAIDMQQIKSVKLNSANSQVYVFMPPPANGEKDSHMAGLLQFFQKNGQPQRIVYISTTGVYGDCQGEWVKENRPVNPQVDRAKRRWDAECQLRQWSKQQQKELVILRVAGIYGAGKLPLARLQKGLPMLQAEDAPFTNRIHADDLVQICLAAMSQGEAGEIYHACDGQEDTMTNYFNQIADLFDYPRPLSLTFEQANQQLSAGMMSYMQESRRLDNQKLKQLGVELKYPTLSEGLRQCLSEMGR